MKLCLFTFAQQLDCYVVCQRTVNLAISYLDAGRIYVATSDVSIITHFCS
jgi:hypothetical protein